MPCAQRRSACLGRVWHLEAVRTDLETDFAPRYATDSYRSWGSGRAVRGGGGDTQNDQMMVFAHYAGFCCFEVDGCNEAKHANRSANYTSTTSLAPMPYTVISKNCQMAHFCCAFFVACT